METPGTSTSTSTSPSSTDLKTPASKLLSSYRRPSSSRTIYGDRFIPSRSSSNFALFNLPNSNSQAYTDDSNSSYTNLLKSALFGPECVAGFSGFQPLTTEKPAPGGRFGSRNSDGNILQISPPNCNIFKYKTETRKSLHSLSPFGYDDQLPGVSHSPVKAARKVPRSPYKVLDAPALQDDFYLNLVDWSSHNVLAVGLGKCVYLWHASSSKVVKLCDLGNDDSVCSVGWAHHGTHLAVGTSNGKLQLWDASRCKRIRTMEGHQLRVGALAWSSSVLSSGSRDKSILQRDIRAQEDYVSKLTGHKAEVCGLKWSYDNRELASGGNDNRVSSHLSLIQNVSRLIFPLLSLTHLIREQDGFTCGGYWNMLLIFKSGYVLKLEKTFYVPSLSRNLISVSRLVPFGYSFTFSETSFSIFYKFECVGNDILSDGL